MYQYEMFELSLTGEPPQGSQALFTFQTVFHLDGEEKTVKGFYAGSNTYKVRFLPKKTGRYSWTTESNIPLEGPVAGEEECLPARTGRHGMVKTEGLHFVYEDGTKYLPFGTTIYALAHQSEEIIEQTMHTLEHAPFNKVRHCIFPKHYRYNHNEPQFFPFEKNAEGKWDVHRPCMDYWEHFEKILVRLGDMGIETDLILFHPYDRWGFSIMSMEEWKIHLDYLLRRLSAYPFIWWSLANEYDLMFNRTMEDWYEIEEFVAANDCYEHLLSNHNCLHFYDFTRPNVTHCCIQTDGMHKAAEWQERYQKPVVFDECCYEGNIDMAWGNISAFELVNRFWRGCVQGAFVTHGETYVSEDEVLWWARGGRLKGQSAQRIAFLKDFLYSLPSCISPWKEPFVMGPDDRNITATVFEKPEEAYERFRALVNAEERELSQAKDACYYGHCGDQVYIKYFARQCCAMCFLTLPEDKKYEVEIIDAWEMTRTTALEEACGRVEVRLPGKEGIAVIAKQLQ